MSTPRERAEQVYGLLTQEEMEILIKHQQDIQKKHHYTDSRWVRASIILNLYFEEMARRQAKGLLK